MPKELELTFSVADYHRTRPLLDGDVRADGISLIPNATPRGDACMLPVYEAFDVAEMSMSLYVMARARGEPVYALPIFPQRLFIQPYVFVAPGAGIRTPADLKGKRVGAPLYRLTVALWARGILQEHYGIAPSDVAWVTQEGEGTEYQVPDGVRLAQGETDVEELLLRGEIDALITPNVPPSFRAGDPRIARLFPNCRAAIMDYFQKTAIFPITHAVVVREEWLEKEPWIVGKLIAAFEEANRLSWQLYEYPKRLSFPTSVLMLEEEEAAFGKDPWRHGLGPNAEALEKFMEYAAAQGYTPRPLSLAESFWTEDGLGRSGGGELSRIAGGA
ncbi:MAG: ABC transporter substrate-binding protein [Alphaproteobacteria bacterium]|nr:ABC transporter substrate-binding protein [Alphaproteobacteria bacterium]